MVCEKIIEQICAELAEDIDVEVCQKVKAHLLTCPECAQQLQAMRMTVHLYALLGEREVPQKIHERLALLLNLPCAESGKR